MKKRNKIIITVLSLVFALSISVSSVFADSYLVENGYSYLKSSDGSSIIYGYDDTSENVELPRYLGGNLVSAVADRAFLKNKYLKSISFAKCQGLKKLGASSFESCSNLTSVVLPVWINQLSTSTFQTCVNLKEVTFYAPLKNIPSYCFYYCTKLDNVSLPETLVSIDSFAFGNCKSLSEVYIPTSVTSIASNAFRNSPNVTIKGSYGSYAEEYANANNIPFEGISAYDVGDVNMDGGINILDATLVQKYVVGIVELSAEQKHLADYNKDGDITVFDATEIQKFIVHLN